MSLFVRGGGEVKDKKKKLDRKEEAHGKRHLSTTENDLELNANSWKQAYLQERESKFVNQKVK